MKIWMFYFGYGKRIIFIENALFKELVDSPQKRTEKTEEVSMIYL